MLEELITKLQDRSPLKYPLVRHCDALNPVNMVTEPLECKLKFEGIVKIMHNSKKLADFDADEATYQYVNFLNKDFS